MKFQGRGITYLAERDATTGKPKAFMPICQDSFAVSLSTESFEHINKCGPVDVPDYRGTKSVSGQLTLSFTDLEDKKFAVGVLGTVTAAATGSVTNETFPSGLANGDVVFLGQAERHRGITALTIRDADSPGDALVANTHYTLDAETGKVAFIASLAGFTQPLEADYTFADPASVSMLSAAQKEYAVMFEGINKTNSNDKCSIELYKVRFDPAQNLDFMSDELQVLELTGTVLADEFRETSDTEFGQFGRRVL